jgi:DNA excision repair protein ERCC-4
MTDFTPAILIDTREQLPLPISYPHERGTLTSGDYSFIGAEHLFSIERKSIPDLIQSLTTERARFLRELERLRGFHFARLLVIGSEADILTGRYRSGANPKAMIHSLYSIEAKFLPVTFAPSAEAGARLVERWAFWFARSLIQAADRIKAAPD